MIAASDARAQARLGISGTPDDVRQACEASLRRLKVNTIDLSYQHRVGPETPIESTVGAGTAVHLYFRRASEAPRPVTRAATG